MRVPTQEKSVAVLVHISNAVRIHGLKTVLANRATLFEAASALCQSVDGSATKYYRSQRRLRDSTLTNTCADWKNNVLLAIATTLNIPPYLKQERVVRQFGLLPIPRQQNDMFTHII